MKKLFIPGIIALSITAFVLLRSKSTSSPSQPHPSSQSTTQPATNQNKTLIEQFHQIPFKKTTLENYQQIDNLCSLLPIDQIKNIYSSSVVKVYPKVIPGAKWCKIDYQDSVTLTIEYQKGVSFITPLHRLKNPKDASSNPNWPLRNLIINDHTDHEEVVYLQVSSNGNLISIFFEKPNQIHLTGKLDYLQKIAPLIASHILEK